MKQHRGFTLIEVMVVIIIIGIITASVILSIGNLSDNRDLLREGKRISILLQTAMDEAVLQGREYGLEVVESGYRFVEFNAFTQQWNEIPGDDLYRYRQLPSEYRLELYVEDRLLLLAAEPAVLGEQDQEEDRDDEDEEVAFYSPHILVFSSGEITPFEMHIVRDYDQELVTVTASILGEFEVREGED